MQDWIAPLAAGVLALVALVLALTIRRTRTRTDAALAQARAETAALRAHLESIVARLDAPAPHGSAAPAEFVITHVGEPGEQPPTTTPPARAEIGAALFADLVLRETVVRAGSLAYGVRRVLDPEVRNRIRFEMRRELKRARKQRRTDTRQARRAWAAGQRAAPDGEGTAA